MKYYMIIIFIFLSCSYGDIETEFHPETLEDLCLYVSYNIKPLKDKINYYQSPKETEKYKLGDCEDYTIYFMFLADQELNIKTKFIVVKKLDTDTYHALAYYDGVYYDPALRHIMYDLPQDWIHIWTWPYDIIMLYATAGYTKAAE